MNRLRAILTHIDFLLVYAESQAKISEEEFKFNKQFRNYRSRKKAIKAKLAMKCFKEYQKNLVALRKVTLESIEKYIAENADIIKEIFVLSEANHLEPSEIAKKMNMDESQVREFIYFYKLKENEEDE